MKHSRAGSRVPVSIAFATVVSMAALGSTMASAQQSIDGNGNCQVVAGHNNNIEMGARYRAATVLSMNAKPTPVLNRLDQHGTVMGVLMSPDALIGRAEIGAEINVLEQRKSSIMHLNVAMVEILSGHLSGTRGWVDADAVQLIQLAE